MLRDSVPFRVESCGDSHSARIVGGHPHSSPPRAFGRFARAVSLPGVGVSFFPLCGNDAPLLWMLHVRGYDLGSVRKVETELQRENRMLREKLAAAVALMKGEL